MPTLKILQSNLNRIIFPPECCCCGAPRLENARGQMVELKKFDAAAGKEIGAGPSLIVPMCDVCRQHWQLAEKHASAGLDLEVKIVGPVMGLVALGFFWDRITLGVTIVVIVVLALLMGLIGIIRRPRTEPGHVPYHRFPAALGSVLFSDAGKECVALVLERQGFAEKVRNLNAQWVEGATAPTPTIPSA